MEAEINPWEVLSRQPSWRPNQDLCGLPRNVGEDAADPYAVASYLKAVHDSHSEGASHDDAR